MTIQEKISQGKVYLGIELGSTRIKATLIDDTYAPIAGGSHEWENRLENGYWTYSLDDIHAGIRSCYADLKKDVSEKYSVKLESLGAIGISAMMHGYMAFDKNDKLLIPFRTWRNTTTEQAANELTKLLNFNIPQRWSIAHLYQAILNNEPHVPEIEHITTLAGYIHFLLTGKRVVGVGEASGMFPIKDGNYNSEMLDKFTNTAKEHGFNKDINNVLPGVLSAGENAGQLTVDGAKFLDTDGDLKAGIPVCPPEGDAGTGMAATNAVLPKTGNVSAGTSIFAMLVLEDDLKGIYPEIDIVTTPDGSPVAMVHCNNCCSELDAWVRVFDKFAKLAGLDMPKYKIYDLLYENSLNGDEDCGGVVVYNYLSGEPVMGLANGKPMYYREPDGNMTLENFFRAQVYASMAALKSGMDILFNKENVSADQFTGHGGLFKTEGVAQGYLANALKTPVSVMKTAGEGGSWGIALLTAYTVCANGKKLADWLETEVFAGMDKKTVEPVKSGVQGFEGYMTRYLKGIEAEKKLGEI